MTRVIRRPNHALQRTRPSRCRSNQRDPDVVYRDCNRRVPCAGSLSLGRSAVSSRLLDATSNWAVPMNQSRLNVKCQMGMCARAWKRRERQRADTVPELDATKVRRK